jgi:hypothetical protein
LEDAFWTYQDSVDKEEGNWKYRTSHSDTFRLGAKIALQAQLVTRIQDGTTPWGRADTGASKVQQYYEVYGTSVKNIDTLHKNWIRKGLPIKTSGLSGWMRFDRENLRVYSLKYDSAKQAYYEYLMHEFEEFDQWSYAPHYNGTYVYHGSHNRSMISINFKDLYVKGGHLGTLETYLGGPYTNVQGISFVHYSKLYKGDGLNVLDAGLGYHPYTFKLHYKNKIYSLR